MCQQRPSKVKAAVSPVASLGPTIRAAPSVKGPCVEIDSRMGTNGMDGAGPRAAAANDIQGILQSGGQNARDFDRLTLKCKRF